MDFESLVRYKALHQVYSAGNSSLVDHMLNDPETRAQIEQNIKLKKLQFDVSQERFDEVESLCAILGMSKREFLDAATSEAVSRAHQIVAEAGVMQSFEDAQGSH